MPSPWKLLFSVSSIFSSIDIQRRVYDSSLKTSFSIKVLNYLCSPKNSSLKLIQQLAFLSPTSGKFCLLVKIPIWHHYKFTDSSTAWLFRFLVQCSFPCSTGDVTNLLWPLRLSLASLLLTLTQSRQLYHLWHKMEAFASHPLLHASGLTLISSVLSTPAYLLNTFQSIYTCQSLSIFILKTKILSWHARQHLTSPFSGSQASRSTCLYQLSLPFHLRPSHPLFIIL